jgi:hypothetical protein
MFPGPKRSSTRRTEDPGFDGLNSKLTATTCRFGCNYWQVRGYVVFTITEWQAAAFLVVNIAAKSRPDGGLLSVIAQRPATRFTVVRQRRSTGFVSTRLSRNSDK